MLKLVVFPVAPIPTATQSREVAQETADRTNAVASEVTVVQLVPAFCVPIIAGTESTRPTATQVLAAGQDTLDRESRFNGEGCDVHVDPLSVPAIPKPPTAVH